MSTSICFLKRIILLKLLCFSLHKSFAISVNKTKASDEVYLSYEDYFSSEVAQSPVTEIQQMIVDSNANRTEEVSLQSLTTLDSGTYTQATTHPTMNTTARIANVSTLRLEEAFKAQKTAVLQFYNVTFKHIPQIIAGEALNITVIIQNYLRIDLHLNITQENHDGNFMNVQLTNDFVDIKRTKSIQVPPKSTKTVQFAMKTWKTQRGVLQIEYKIEAKSGIEMKSTSLVVRPEGAYHETEQYYYVDLENAFKFAQQLKLHQSNFGFYSDKLHMRGYGNAVYPLLAYFNTTIESQQTGEQAMSRMLLNYMALEYLKLANRLDSSIEFELEKNIIDGYELLKRHFNKLADGSLSNFLGIYQNKSSTWLTAYVVGWLPLLSEYTDIQEMWMAKSLKFLLGQQAEDGHFEEQGDVFNRKQNCTIAMTAHVILGLIEHQQNSPAIKTAIENGLKYIHHKLNAKPNRAKHFEYISLYSKAIATYVFYKTGHQSLRSEFTKLKKIAKHNGGYIWWTEDDNDDMETTAYMLLTTLATRADHWSVKDILPIVKWLIRFGDIYTNSVLYPTKATVTGLMAILRYEEKFNVLRPSLVLDTKTKTLDGYVVKNKISIKDATDNKLIELPDLAAEIDMIAMGKGTALAHISHSYYLMDIKDAVDFTLTVNTTKSNEQPIFNLKISLCLEYHNLQSNLLVIIVPFPSGYVVTNDVIQQLYAVKYIRHVAVDAETSALRIFVIDLHYKDMLCLSIKMKRLFNVACQRPVAVHAYEYNDLTKRDIKYMEIPSTLCDLCEKEKECKRHCKTDS